MTVSPKRILWPTDFSELSLLGGRYARAFRETFKAELRVIHVVPPPLSPEVSVMLPTEVPMSVSEPEILDACRSGIERVIAEHFDGDDTIICDAFFGNPWSGVCEYARQQAVDLIIVSTHGRTGLRHALIGSTAERIVQHAPCPVLTVKSPEKDFIVE
jgi:nucleotide-binding universal stress UspA family protein